MQKLRSHEHLVLPSMLCSSIQDSLLLSLLITWTDKFPADSSGASNVTGLPLQTILNAEDSPSRVQVPNTPQGVPFAVNQVSPSPLPNVRPGLNRV